MDTNGKYLYLVYSINLSIRAACQIKIRVSCLFFFTFFVER